MKNGGGSKADEAMQGEATQNQEDENVLRRLSSDDENVLRRASDDDDLFCRVHFIGFHSSEGWVGKRLWKKKRDGLSGTIMMMMIMIIMIMIMVVMMIRMRIMMMSRGFG